MTNTAFLRLFSLLVLCFLFSCNADDLTEKDLIKDEDPKEEEIMESSLGGNECFEWVFPLSVEMVDGTILTGEDRISLREQMKEWYEDHPDAQEKFHFVYPLQVIHNGESVIVNSDEELKEIRKACHDHTEVMNDHENDCYKFIFPMSLELPDGTIISGNRDELHEQIKEWYDSHPDVEEKPAIVFPVDVHSVLADVPLTIESQEHLRALIEECKDHFGHNEMDGHNDCYEIIFPIHMELPDGTIIGGNREELHEQIKEWYEAHPDVMQQPAIVFPIEVHTVLTDGPLTLENREQLHELKLRCEEFFGQGGMNDHENDCYEIIFPIHMELPDGTIIGGNREELHEQIGQWYEAHPDVAAEPAIVFPIEVRTILADGPLTINSREELQALREECHQLTTTGGGGMNENDCYEIIFPIHMELPDGTIIGGNREELHEQIGQWYEAHPDVAAEPAIVFPIEVRTILADGILTINHPEQLAQLREECHELTTTGGGQDHDCPELEANIGDPCRDDHGHEGVVNEHCECEL